MPTSTFFCMLFFLLVGAGVNGDKASLDSDGTFSAELFRSGYAMEAANSEGPVRMADAAKISFDVLEIPSPAGKVHGCKVAIVGAGYGGVYFAYRLALDEGMVSPKDVCIFEASTRRIGGRIYSLRNLLGDPELAVDVGGYRYVPSQHLITSLIEDGLNLTTRCYYPLTCTDERRIVVDESGLNQVGYATPVETMLKELVEAGLRVHYGYRLTGVFDVKKKRAGKRAKPQPMELTFANGGSAVVEQVMLNIPSESLATLDTNSILFKKQSKEAQGGYLISESAPTIKVYAEYADAWWVTKLGLMEGYFRESSNPMLAGRYHDGPVRCFDKNGNQIPLTSDKNKLHKCNGALLVAYFGSANLFHQMYYSNFKQGDDPLSIFAWDESAPGFELIKGVHEHLMSYHSENFTNAGVSPADIEPPLYMYMANWLKENPVTSSLHEWTMYLPGMTIAQTTKALLRPVPGYDLFIANEAYGVSPGWAEGSVMMAERVLAHELGAGKPSWIRNHTYYESGVIDLGYFDMETVQLFGHPLPKSGANA